MNLSAFETVLVVGVCFLLPLGILFIAVIWPGDDR